MIARFVPSRRRHREPHEGEGFGRRHHRRRWISPRRHHRFGR